VKKLLVTMLAIWAGSAAAQESALNIELNNIALRNDVCDMPDLDCDNVGEVLLNDITECRAENSENTPEDCFAAVSLSARGDISFIR